MCPCSKTNERMEENESKYIHVGGGHRNIEVVMTQYEKEHVEDKDE